MSKWTDNHKNDLALLRTLVGFLNLLLASLVALRVFGMI